jgi:FtsZ-binding cell division protein ZapB
MEMDQPEKAPDEAKIKNTVDTIEKLDLELGKTRSKLDTLESKLHDLESTPKKSDSLQELKKRRALLLHKVVRLRSDKRKLEGDTLHFSA